MVLQGGPCGRVDRRRTQIIRAIRLCKNNLVALFFVSTTTYKTQFYVTDLRKDFKLEEI
jgi:hypothetical protein